MAGFKLHSSYGPAGDQPQAIEGLVSKNKQNIACRSITDFVLTHDPFDRILLIGTIKI